MNNRTGFSLVEVVVAVTLVSLAAMGSAAALGVAARTQRTASSKRELTAAARTEATLLSARPCATLASGSRISDGVLLEWSVEGPDASPRVRLTARRAASSVSLTLEPTCN